MPFSTSGSYHTNRTRINRSESNTSSKNWVEQHATYLIWIIVLLIALLFISVGVSVASWNELSLLQREIRISKQLSLAMKDEWESHNETASDRFEQLQSVIASLQANTPKVGPKGEVGSKGDVGLPGIKGEAGRDGFPGPIGPKGMPGLRGLDGILGQKGSEGLHGLPGLPGLMGPVGPKGEIGLSVQGLKGDPGSKGEKGDIGVFPVISTPTGKHFTTTPTSTVNLFTPPTERTVAHITLNTSSPSKTATTSRSVFKKIFKKISG